MWENFIMSAGQVSTQYVIESGVIGVADLFYARLLRRKSFKYWKRYANRKIQGARAKYKAEYHYKMKLKQRMLAILSQNVTHRRNLNLASLKLTVMYKRMLLSDAWKRWSFVIQDLYDSVPKSHVRMAKCFHRKAILRRYFRCWIVHMYSKREIIRLKRVGGDFCRRLHFNRYIRIWKIVYERKKENTVLEEKAIKCYHDLLMESTIKQWIGAHNRVMILKILWQQAVVYYEKKLLGKIVNAWIKFCNVNIEMENLERDARNYHRVKLLHKYLKLLSLNVSKSRKNRAKMQTANHFYTRKLVHRIFSKWKAYHIQLIQYAMKIQTICSALDIRLKAKTLYHWRLYVVHKKCNRRRVFTSFNRYRKTLMSKGLKKLKAYLKYKKLKKRQLGYMANALDEIKMNVQKVYLVKWRNALFYVARERHKILMADEFQAKLLTRKCIRRWMIFSQEQRVKKLRKKNLLNRAQLSFLKRFVSIWYTKYQRAVNERDEENRANGIYAINVRRKFFNNWKKYVKVRIERRLEIEAAKEYHKKLVVEEGLRNIFKICLHNIDERYESRENEIVRKAVEDFEILKIFFNKWLRAVSILRRDPKSNTDSAVRKNICKDKRPRLVIPNFIKNSASFANITKTAEKFNHKEYCQSHISDAKTESLRLCRTSHENLYNCRDDVKEKALFSETFSPDSLDSTLNSVQTYTVHRSPFFQSLIKKCSPVRLKNVCNFEEPKDTSQTLLPPSAFYVPSSNY